MKVAIFGATGFIGKELQKAINAKGWQAMPLDTRKSGWESQVKDADAVINLAGHPLFKNRWNDRIKALIHDSRVDGTRKIVAALKGSKVKTLVNASAVGIYGSSEADVDENSKPADDFLARVCKNWEEEAKNAERLHGIRTVIVRIGVVLGKDGGALEKLLPPFKMGVGGPIGSGKQSMNWVHVEDVAGIFVFAIENDKIAPIVNATAPNIVSNKEFSTKLGKVLHRPAKIPLPKPALYLAVGEAAGVIASGQRAHPNATIASGYHFHYTDVEAALKNILG